MEEMVRKCAFCGRDESEVKRMFESDSTGLCICEKCIESCYDMLEADREEYDDDSEVDLGLTLLKPHEIKAKLDEHIVGKDDAKKVFCKCSLSNIISLTASSKILVQEQI